jgi:5-methylcytosine-specific restriction endonuclease McrA
MPSKKTPDSARLDRVVAAAQEQRIKREQGYREQALKLYPWICGRCGREFTRENLRELTVHHRDHNHDNNPTDGSNWELLCLYCHDNEHAKYVDAARYGTSSADKPAPQASHKGLAGLADLFKKDGV